MTSLTTVLAAILAFIVADGIWLGLVMTDFYRTQLADIGQIVDGKFAPHWPAAVLVYVLLGLGVAVFVVPRAHTITAAAGLGALFGLVVYGVYDLTNYSTLARYPAILTIADLAWGTFACAVVSTAVFAVSPR